MLHESHFAYLHIKISFLKQTDGNFIMILKELHQKLLNILFLYLISLLSWEAQHMEIFSLSLRLNQKSNSSTQFIITLGFCMFFSSLSHAMSFLTIRKIFFVLLLLALTRFFQSEKFVCKHDSEWGIKAKQQGK